MQEDFRKKPKESTRKHILGKDNVIAFASILHSSNIEFIDFNNVEKLIDACVVVMKVATTILKLDKENFV